tara:strand:+ start:275 stop:574 length:300 start_codon:yes stop_codon:yes gene_type:complete
MATAEGPIKKMLNFIASKKAAKHENRTTLSPSQISEEGNVQNWGGRNNPIDAVDKNIPADGDVVKVSKKLKDKEVELKHKKTKSDDAGEYNVYKAKKIK